MNGLKRAFGVYENPKMIVMLILGFFSALPFVLIFSTLSYWLSDNLVKVEAIALFSLARLPYSFKFLWSPYIDSVSLPYLSARLGRRRSWALVFQVCLIAGLIALVHTNPLENPLATGVCALAVAFFSASQDIVFDAFRIEYVAPEDQGAASAVYVFGYRVGMIVAGAGALFLSDVIGWTHVYEALALSGVVGMATILIASEPRTAIAPRQKNFFKDAVVAPVADFVTRKDWLIIVLFILTYKLCETSIGTVVPKLYKEAGFSNTQIATVVKLWGVAATIFGGFLGGALIVRIGVVRSLVVCGILQGVSNLPFAVLAVSGNSFFWLTFSIVSDSLASGMATTAFVAYMSSLCNTAYTATQYALLTSLMALPRDLLGASSGWLVAAIGWAPFFVFTAFLSLPGILLIVLLDRRRARRPATPEPEQARASADTP